MTEQYVTLFDSLFLPQGLCLYRSMEKNLLHFTLWVLCVDDEAYEVLIKLNLRHMRLLKLAEYETGELLAIKKQRTRGEYCWTLTPYAPGFVFASDKSAERVTYIDADLWFRKDPGGIFEELETFGKGVLITEHAYHPKNDQSEIAGKYCVQFVTFSRNPESEKIRSWWEHRCIEWCYSRYEDGKFGDQKYLDVWPEIFHKTVHVLKNKSAALAPWNVERYPYSESIFYHFHGLRLVSADKIFIGSYEIPKPVINNIYIPYIQEIKISIQMLTEAGWIFRIQGKKKSRSQILLSTIRNFYRLLKSIMPKDTLYIK